MRFRVWEFPKELGVPYLGVLIIKILLSRVLYSGPLNIRARSLLIRTAIPSSVLSKWATMQTSPLDMKGLEL